MLILIQEIGYTEFVANCLPKPGGEVNGEIEELCSWRRKMAVRPSWVALNAASVVRFALEERS
jgi:hypothetical protein